MCLVFSKRDLALMATGAIIFSPLLLLGGGVYMAGRGARSAARTVKRRRIKRFWRKIDEAKGTSPLQLLWDQLNQETTFAAKWRVGLALISLGDFVGARALFRSVIRAFDSVDIRYHKVPIAGRYFLARAELLLQQWPAAIEQLRLALEDFVHSKSVADAEAASVARADVQGMLAYAIHANETRAPQCNFADIEQALRLADEAAALDPANARHPYVAAWCRFTLGIRTDAEGKAVSIDAAHLHQAISLLDGARELAVAAEREAQVAIVAEFGERPTLPAVEGTVVEATKDVPPDSLKEAQRTAQAECVVTASDDDDDSVAEPPQETLQATATGEGAGGVSIAEVLSLQAQVYLALGQHAEAETALAAARAIDASVSHSGLSETEGEVDPRVGLLAPWNRVMVVAATKDLTLHDFAPATLVKPTWCDHCMKRIKGFHHGLRCKACGYTIHDEPKCIQSASDYQCFGKERDSPPADAPPSHQHVFRVRRVHTTHDCMQCHKFIMLMTRAVECTVCRCFAHLDCAKSVPNSVIDHAKQVGDENQDVVARASM